MYFHTSFVNHGPSGVHEGFLPYSKIYDMGAKHTGCVFCMFGVHLERTYPNRFQLLKKTHPALHTYCMEKLGLRDILKYINIRGD